VEASHRRGTLMLLTSTAAVSLFSPLLLTTGRAAESIEPTLRTLKANGIRIRVAETGTGPLVLFLHEFWSRGIRGGTG
jgi:hypothetical protein